MAQKKTHQVAGQTKRRAMYGTNVAIAVIAAVAVVILLNWIVAGNLNDARFDWTATRQYSLSDQTYKVLDDLDSDYEIVPLLPRTSAVADANDAASLQQALDVIDEYDRRSGKISARHLDPRTDIDGIESFFTSLRDRYMDELNPTIELINQTRNSLKEMKDQFIALTEQAMKVADDPTIQEKQVIGWARERAREFSVIARNFGSLEESVPKELDDEMPDYGSIRRSTLSTVETGHAIVEQIIAVIEKVVSSDDFPPAAKDRLLKWNKPLVPTRDQLAKLKARLQTVTDSADYDQLVRDKNQYHPIFIVGPKKVLVIPLKEMIREPDQTQRRDGAPVPERRFQGEEKITGALLSMNMKNPPMVVFLTGGGPPATGQGGGYSYVAKKLEALNFDVQSWSPVPAPSRFGQPMPPQPKPQPKPGQKAVWIVLPGPPTNFQNPMAGQGKQQINEAIKQELDKGHGVLFMVGFDNAAMFNASQAEDLFKPWGITHQAERLILREMLVQRGQRAPNPVFQVSNWSAGHTINEPLKGMIGLFMYGSPIVLGQPDGKGETWPLVEVQAPRMWAETDMQSQQTPPEYDEEQARDSFVIAAAAERNGTRVVVASASHFPGGQLQGWATDGLTSAGPGGYPGLADVYGAMFPANTELFVNSVFWLANMEELIAASPRSQDLRRIADMDRSAVSALRWLLSTTLPLVALAAGVVVYVVRQRN